MIVNLVGNSIEVKSGPSGSPEYFALADISNIFPFWIPAAGPGSVGPGFPETYPYPTRTELVISFSDVYSKPPLKIELQKITAGALVAFNGGTKNDLDNAASVVNAWL